MTCTTYNDSVSYNAAIPYNGACVSPSPAVLIGGFGAGRHYAIPRRKKKEDEDGILVAIILELLDDE